MEIGHVVFRLKDNQAIRVVVGGVTVDFVIHRVGKNQTTVGVYAPRHIPISRMSRYLGPEGLKIV